MPKDSFQFKQFTIRQRRCAMKVGTDGTLLGAWAGASTGSSRVLDIGTGTGLIALMMAQRYPEATIMAVDIDGEAVSQARENVAASPFSARIHVEQCDVVRFATDTTGNPVVQFDAIVCNPPYFVDSLESPDELRTLARHAASLSYEQLTQAAWRLLKENGRFSLIIPSDYRLRFDAEACLRGFFLTRLYAVRTTPHKPPKRYLMEYRKHPEKELDTEDVVIETAPHERSPWYRRLTDDFYIK